MNKILLVVILLLVGCSKYSKDLRKALGLSGDNRIELEKVLEHYSIYPKDSLKLKAAKFLIANMPGHYSIGGNEVNRFIEELDSIAPNLDYYYKIPFIMTPYYTNKFLNVEKIYDIDVITADYLIQNIDFKFALRDIVPWGKEIPFELFCDAILPYRYDVEPLIKFDKGTLDKHIQKIKNNKIINYDIYINSNNIMKLYINNIYKNNNIKDYLKAVNYFHLKKNCNFIALQNVYWYNWLYIPAYIDFTPHWAAMDNRHQWIYYAMGNSSRTESYILNEKISKIYRKKYINNNDDKKDFFDKSFLCDVTDEYITTIDIIINSKYNNIPKESIYLCTFNERVWKPIDVSNNLRNKAKFENIGINILYCPVFYENDVQKAYNYPFIINSVGKKIEFIPDYNNKQSFVISRKFPLRKVHIYSCLNDVSKISLEASNDSLFINSDSIGVFNNTKIFSLNRCEINNQKKYRYWKLKPNIYQYISELKLKQNTKIIYDISVLEKYKNIIDNNYLTVSYINNELIVDTKKSIRLTEIDIFTPSDANNVYPGHIYELLYHNGKDWVSHEIIEASSYSLEFRNVPSNTLFWLRNLTEGKEERPFYIDNGKIIFI